MFAYLHLAYEVSPKQSLHLNKSTHDNGLVNQIKFIEVLNWKIPPLANVTISCVSRPTSPLSILFWVKTESRGRRTKRGRTRLAAEFPKSINVLQFIAYES